MKFGPLNQRTTPDNIHGLLRAAILDGRLAPGSQLREAHIAADLGVNRAPLREALIKLEEEGLVVRIPFRGAFVAEVSAEDIAEIASLRFLVEPYAAQLSFDALHGPQKARMTRVIKALHAATDKRDIPASIDAHLQFHGLFYEFSGHKQLQSLWGGWESKLRLFFGADHRSYADLHEIAVAHEQLAEMLLTGDWDRFRHELAHHVHSAPGAPLDLYEKAPEDAQLAQPQ
ncbi:GntR family transcriptional regulator [Intrasporangium mesophilum]